MPLLLFDIDGTITSGIGPYEPCQEQAIDDIFKKRMPFSLDGYHGLTQIWILRDFLKKARINYDNHSLKVCLDRLCNIFNTNTNEVKLIPGADKSIANLSKDHLLLLLTGNPRKMARKKMEIHGLNKYFLTGAYGDEDFDRAELVEFAIARALKLSDKKSWSKNKEDTYIIGDTIFDMHAAKKANVKGIGITTGNTSRKDLEKAGADFVIDSLSEIPSILNSQ